MVVNNFVLSIIVTDANDMFLIFSSYNWVNVKGKTTAKVNKVFKELYNLRLTSNTNKSEFAAFSINKANLPFDNITKYDCDT
jgi:hypothetical protein